MMNKIKKAMLAFVIFGFIGGCEAANVTATVNAHLKVNGTQVQHTYTDPYCQIRIGANYLNYHKDYAKLMNKFLDKGKDYLTESDFCKSMLRFFLLDSEDTLDRKYRMSKSKDADLLKLRNKVKAAFFWHITKHYIDCKEPRYTEGNVHTLIIFNNNSNGGELKIGDLTIPCNTVGTLETIIESAIDIYDFHLDRTSIALTHTTNTLNDSKALLLSLNASIYKCNINDKKKILFNAFNEVRYDKIQNVVFYFKLLNKIVNEQYNQNNFNVIDCDGSFGSFYYTVN